MDVKKYVVTNQYGNLFSHKGKACLEVGKLVIYSDVGGDIVAAYAKGEWTHFYAVGEL